MAMQGQGSRLVEGRAYGRSANDSPGAGTAFVWAGPSGCRPMAVCGRGLRTGRMARVGLVGGEPMAAWGWGLRASGRGRGGGGGRGGEQRGGGRGWPSGAERSRAGPSRAEPGRAGAQDSRHNAGS